MEVGVVDREHFMLKLSYSKEMGVLRSVQRMIESLGMDVTSTSINPLDEHHMTILSFLHSFTNKTTCRDTGPDDVSLTITHCGICYAGVAWAKNIPRNTIYPAHEIVGIVKEVGSNVRRFKVGDHVGVGPYVNSCKTCEHCKIRDEVHCDVETAHTFNSIDEDGTITRGGYSSYIVIQEGYVFKIPDNYSFISAAPLLCAGITVNAPMMRHKMNEPGKSLGVIGLGGLGHLAVKFGLHSLARSLDFIIDTASRNQPFDSCMALLKPSEVLVLVGFPSEVKFNPMSVLVGLRAISLSIASGTKDMQEMLDFYAANNIHPEVEVILIQYVNEALERMENMDVKYQFVIDIKNSLK
ncbi:hypothetical protein GIB67_003361 [Kingdonia uniflora]|uniref:Alcohol dehydrogenase-like N-terminal domain-containing protein n=1 Tax=Kingdonia uniflora TaxID=39325 RepID=A0A7J7P960_9MAGN|nr:hypothetical protein GIB67_003361 [Kingdonia uniflora]